MGLFHPRCEECTNFRPEGITVVENSDKTLLSPLRQLGKLTAVSPGRTISVKKSGADALALGLGFVGEVILNFLLGAMLYGSPASRFRFTTEDGTSWSAPLRVFRAAGMLEQVI